MSIDLAVVLILINIIGVLIISHVIRYTWTWQVIHNRNWCMHVSIMMTILLFSAGVAANSFIGSVYNLTP